MNVTSNNRWVDPIGFTTLRTLRRFKIPFLTSLCSFLVRDLDARGCEISLRNLILVAYGTFSKTVSVALVFSVISVKVLRNPFGFSDTTTNRGRREAARFLTQFKVIVSENGQAHVRRPDLLEIKNRLQCTVWRLWIVCRQCSQRENIWDTSCRRSRRRRRSAVAILSIPLHSFVRFDRVNFRRRRPEFSTPVHSVLCFSFLLVFNHFFPVQTSARRFPAFAHPEAMV